tara:strand:+ start:225 stop:632 length:408 start_codon:yes stop_codon:yes gene_type:complete
MSQQHFCADGTSTWTGRASTPKQRASVCINNGGEVDSDGNTISSPAGTAALGHGFTCYSCENGKPVRHPYSSLEQDGCPVGQTMGIPNNTACLQSIGTTTTTAGVGVDSKLVMYLLVAGGLYYAYSQGMFNKLIK